MVPARVKMRQEQWGTIREWVKRAEERWGAIQERWGTTREQPEMARERGKTTRERCRTGFPHRSILDTYRKNKNAGEPAHIPGSIPCQPRLN